MLFRTYLIISVFTTGILIAQTKISNPERETFTPVQQKGDEKTSKSEKALIQNLATMEKYIEGKVADIENLQVKAAEFNKGYLKEIRVVTENADVPATGYHKFLVSRYVEYTFEGGNKIKEIRVVSRHKSLTNDMNSFIKVFSFTPGNLESLKATIDNLETKAQGISEVEDYKNFAPEAKLHALKKIDITLQDTIYRLDTFIQKSQLKKIKKNKNQLEGL